MITRFIILTQVDANIFRVADNKTSKFHIIDTDKSRSSEFNFSILQKANAEDVLSRTGKITNDKFVVLDEQSGDVFTTADLNYDDILSMLIKNQ